MTQAPSSFDVLVIGGGIAGLVAANRAAELGKRTVVLEKGTADRYLCSSRYTGGTFHIGYTMGGIAVDQDGAVLDGNNSPIPGLYAAGGATGGLEGGPSIGYVGGLIKAVFGLRAAEKIVGVAAQRK